MNEHVKVSGTAAAALVKALPGLPVFIRMDRDAVAIRAGTTFAGRRFDEQTAIPAPAGGFVAGTDYGVSVEADAISVVQLDAVPTIETHPTIIGGFHFAPGGCAVARDGGDDLPAINPHSMWDWNFRPACPDPRGMVLIEMPVEMPDGRRFWCDIYLLGVDHTKDGTSRFGVTIADGSSPPKKPNGGRFSKLDYGTAVVVMEHHGKGLLSFEEFIAAAFGVTERSVHDGDPKVTKLDAPRTSHHGVMQATGNVWVWGHDGDPDQPRASVFGGSWWHDGDAGSRCADVSYDWPGYSDVSLGARGRGDHLQLA